MTGTDDDLPVFTAWLAFLEWLLPVTDGFPHRARFTFTQRLQNLALDVAEDLVDARYAASGRKVEVLRRANLRLEKLRVLLRLAHGQRHLATRQYEHAVRQLWEVGRMVGGWHRQQRNG